MWTVLGVYGAMVGACYLSNYREVKKLDRIMEREFAERKFPESKST